MTCSVGFVRGALSLARCVETDLVPARVACDKELSEMHLRHSFAATSATIHSSAGATSVEGITCRTVV